jgi:1,2-phenylacetyl-CoA epoxidase PaaB subunit
MKALMFARKVYMRSSNVRRTAVVTRVPTSAAVSERPPTTDDQRPTTTHKPARTLSLYVVH